jgi:hypothetical protein
MSIVENEVLPPGLIQSVMRLSYFKTERRKLQCDVSTTGPNQQVRCKLPTSGLLGIGSISYHAKVAVATTTSDVPPLGCFIQDLRVSGDGQTIDEINSYNLLFMSLLNSSCSTAHARTRYSMGCLQPKPTFVCVNTATGATDATNEAAAQVDVGDATATNGQIVSRHIPVSIAAGSSKWAVECDWLGFLGSVSDYLMADLFPALTIEFNMAGNNILGSADGTWSITDQYFTIDVCNYASALESMMSLFEIQPGVITPITYAFDRYIVQQQSCQASTTNTVTFNMASSNLRKVIYSYRKNGFATQAVTVAGNHAPNFFVYSAGDAGANFTTSNLYLNGKQYHQYPVALYENEAGEIDPSGYLDALVSLGLESDNQFDNLVESHNNWLVSRFFHIYNWDWRGSDASVVSGINTQGQSDLQLVVKSDSALTAGGQWLLIGQCSTMLHISPNRTIAIEY